MITLDTNLPQNMDTCFSLVLWTTVFYVQTSHGFLHKEIAKPVVLYTDRTSIYKRLGNSSIRPIVTNQRSIISLDFDYKTGKVYWTDIDSDTINSIDTKNNKLSNPQILVRNVKHSEGLSVDWINQKLYWTDSEDDTIEVADFDGTNRITLVDSGLDRPRGIAVYPYLAYMYWTDWGKTPKIERCGMNGDPFTRETLVSTRIKWPNGITIDFANRRILWIDGFYKTIESINNDGLDRRVLYKSPLHMPFRPFALSVLMDQVYLSDWMEQAILRMNSTTRHVTKLASVSRLPMGLRVYHRDAQPDQRRRSYCFRNNGGCSHICLLSPGSNPWTCHCPHGLNLDSDWKTCTNKNSTCTSAQFRCSDGTCLPASLVCNRVYDCPDASDESHCKLVDPVLFYADRSSIYQRLSNASVQRIVSNQRSIVSLDYDNKTGKIFWTDVISETISTIDRKSNKSAPHILIKNVTNADGLSVDWINQKLYWTDSETDTIEVADFDGTNRITLIDSGLDKPRGIAVYPNKAYMYWTDWGKTPKIERCGMNGDPFTRETLVSTKIKWPNGITIDFASSRIFWVDGFHKTIESISYDGSDRRMIYGAPDNVPFRPFAVAVYQDQVYVSVWGEQSIMMLSTTSPRKKRIARLSLGPMGIIVWHRDVQPDNTNVNPCFQNNGGCSHICLLAPGRIQNTCHCPGDFTLNADGKTCKTNT